MPISKLMFSFAVYPVTIYNMTVIAHIACLIIFVSEFSY